MEIENYKDLVTRPTTFTFFATLPGKQNEDYYKVRYESSQFPLILMRIYSWISKPHRLTMFKEEGLWKRLFALVVSFKEMEVYSE